VRDLRLTVARRRRPLRWLLAAAILLAGVADAAWVRGQSAADRVYVISISGNVEPGMAAFLRRALSEVPDTPDSVVVVEMDTFGGRVDSALEMVDALVGVENARTIAFVTRKAISAGALISLACNQLVMKPNTTIGDCAPIAFTQEGPTPLGEKFQSPLRAKFRTLARRNGYPAVLAESMVTASMVVYRVDLDGRERFMDAQQYEDLTPDQRDRIRSKQTVVAEGELLTMDDSEARDLGFSAMTVADLDDLLARMNLSDRTVTRVARSWSEHLVGLIGTLTPILMLVGLGSLFTEIKAPGFGVPGIVGLLCLALVFFGQYLVGLADYTELLLLVAGGLLMGVEWFVLPGFGIAGIAGSLLIVGGLLLSLQDFVIPDPSLPWQKALLIGNLFRVLGAAVGAFLLAALALRYLLPSLSRRFQGPYLAATLADARIDPPAAATMPAGRTGTAITPLRPSGKALIDARRCDVVTRGEFLEKGTPIRVISAKGARIVVARAGGHE
jgi:membrane-bound serine protease (ClpP class)